tara:strand:+ start:2909 stop:3910 length:1002 start_codon:yes stop_codon:yes gene_type:complete
MYFLRQLKYRTYDAISARTAAITTIVLSLGALLLSTWWSLTPDVISKKDLQPQGYVTGYATVSAIMHTTDRLLHKPGGFLSNDIFILSYLMDNMPAFEFGALEQIRDLSLVLRQDFSRSQSQSAEDKDLAKAQNQLNISHTSWSFPSSESEYNDALEALAKYRSHIMRTDQRNAQFYARADNLTHWLEYVNSRLGGLSQRLSASIAQEREDLALAGDAQAQQSTPTDAVFIEQTPWWKLDDVFYQSRGACWALLNFMYAVEIDFKGVLEKKNATVSLRQIIRELEATQETLWSPIVLNGSGFGVVANHSLIMANYISRANAAVIDLSNLLKTG